MYENGICYNSIPVVNDGGKRDIIKIPFFDIIIESKIDINTQNTLIHYGFTI